MRTKLSIIRDKRTEPKVFRELVYEIGLYVGFQATARLNTTADKNVRRFQPSHFNNFSKMDTLEHLPLIDWLRR